MVWMLAMFSAVKAIPSGEAFFGGVQQCSDCCGHKDTVLICYGCVKVDIVEYLSLLLIPTQPSSHTHNFHHSGEVYFTISVIPYLFLHEYRAFWQGIQAARDKICASDQQDYKESIVRVRDG